uniref:Nodule-specific cysteine-rich peptide L31 n=1 Tax=Lens culinaris TaxID=3864 RepID=A0A7T8IG77_LENCU|nr:nodule-specific cysteine-rich peptide L31 [Lens culinaris]
MQSGKNVAKILKLFYILILYGFLVHVAAQHAEYPIECKTDDDCPAVVIRSIILNLTYVCMDNFCVSRIARN